jgi:hypothetical protein
MSDEGRGDILKAVAALLSNLGGTEDRPVTSTADIRRLQRAWDDYHGVCWWGVYSESDGGKWWPRRFRSVEEAEAHLQRCKGPGTKAEVRKIAAP